MIQKSSAVNKESDFRTLIPEYPDEEIVNILKKRNLYQPEAAELAIKEAIKRGIIHSEQDLMAVEYRTKPLEFHLFPNIEKPDNKRKIRISIARSILIAGVIPLIWGFMQYFRGNETEGLLLIVSGILWIYSSFRLVRAWNLLFISILLFLALMAIVYIIRHLILIKTIHFYDFFAPVAAVVLLVYGLLFIHRLKS